MTLHVPSKIHIRRLCSFTAVICYIKTNIHQPFYSLTRTGPSSFTVYIHLPNRSQMLFFPQRNCYVSLIDITTTRSVSLDPGLRITGICQLPIGVRFVALQLQSSIVFRRQYYAEAWKFLTIGKVSPNLQQLSHL